MAQDNLRIVMLESPEFCAEIKCRFRGTSLVPDPNNIGKSNRVFACKRLDCDNWITSPNDKFLQGEID